MNKKLFSWKALAGLALLVAMGLTSCKQDNPVEIDESGSYVIPSKPVTPTAKGTLLSGFKTCTELNNLIAGTKDITDNIGAGKSVTITADCSNLEVTTTDYKISLPSKTDATINLQLTGAFKTKDGAVLEINDQAIDALNLTLEKADYVFDAPYSTVTLKSAVNTAVVKTGTKSSTPFTVAGGASIENLDYSTGYVVVSDGAAINAYVAKANVSATKDGIKLANVKNSAGKDYFISNVLVAADADVYSYNTTDKGAPIYAINTVSVANGVTASVFGYIKSVKGLGKDRGSKVDGSIYWVTDEISNITLLDTWTNSPSFQAAIVKDVTVNGQYPTMYNSSASNITFAAANSSIDIYIPGESENSAFTYTFSKATFATGSRIYAGYWANAIQNPILDENGNQVVETFYYYQSDPTDASTYVEHPKLSDFTDAERKAYDIKQGSRKLYLTPQPDYSENFLATLSLSECKLGSSSYTKDSDASLMSSFSALNLGGGKQTKVDYVIDGVSYKVVNIYDENNNFVKSSFLKK